MRLRLSVDPRCGVKTGEAMKMEKVPWDVDPGWDCRGGWFGGVRGRERETQKRAFRWAVRHMFIISRTFARGRYSRIVSEARAGTNVRRDVVGNVVVVVGWFGM